MTNKSPQDEIIAEVRSIREDLAELFGYDVDRLYEEAKRREEASDRKKVAVAPKHFQPVS